MALGAAWGLRKLAVPQTLRQVLRYVEDRFKQVKASQSIPYPVDFKIDPGTGLRPNFSLLDGLSAATLAGKEWAGLLGYRLMGWTQELFPAPAIRRPAN